jgi:hypothetical protein
MNLFILDDNGEVLFLEESTENYMKYVIFWGDRGYKMANDQVKDVTITTSYIPVMYTEKDGPIAETTILGGPFNGEKVKAKTQKEAVKNHLTALTKVYSYCI